MEKTKKKKTESELLELKCGIKPEHRIKATSKISYTKQKSKVVPIPVFTSGSPYSCTN
jgi:hypothetical protein